MVKRGVDKRRVADELRDLLNIMAVYEEEYDLPEEVVFDVRTRIEEIAKALQAM